MTLLLPLLAFLFGSLLVAAAALALAPARSPRRIERRLGEVTGTRTEPAESDETVRQGVHRHDEEDRQRRAAIAARKWASCSSGWCTPATAASEALVVFFGIRLGCARLCFRAC